MALHHRTKRLYVCDAFHGFGVLGPKGGFVTPLSTAADAEPFRFCNAVYVHQPTGNVYFTDASINLLLLSNMAYINMLIMFLLSFFVSCFPSVFRCEIFRTIPLPPAATGPQSIAFELATGRFYVGVADGRILQYNGLNGFAEHGFTGRNRSKALCDGVTDPDLGRACGRPFGLGLHYATNQLYICDGYIGLMVLGSGGRLAAPVSTGAEGVPYRYCMGIDVHQLSGNVFFSDYTTAYDLRDAAKGLAPNDSTDSTGRLLMYNPSTRRVTVLLRNLSGPAGVAVSQDGSYVLVSNYNSNNTIRFWLMGPRADTYDIVNIQVRPKNIQRTLLGDYWQAAAMVKQATQTLVPIGQRINGSGRVLQTLNLEQWYGNNLVSEVQEFRGSLYITSPSVDFIGVYTV
ncbi:protein STRICTOSIDINE SYNTHASE-LIKE 11-like [Hibiscus syriacus]|uniref:protein STRICTOSIDINE SYNTHASE-LIKE 11-like n=1 Tax=Hibiscus syriacus TaxID=106335 RepID=UPI00192210CD|nr:protein STRICTOSIDINE SYNTHASE-LIKE 11-like [Hibiscus syriacus]